MKKWLWLSILLLAAGAHAAPLWQIGGEMTESHFGQTGPMAEAILLGTVAIRVPGETLEWDHQSALVRNHATANRYLKRTYRDGWKVASF